MWRRTYTPLDRRLLRPPRIWFNAVNLHGQLSSYGGGVYRIFRRGHEDRTLYVGTTKSAQQRLYGNLVMGQIRSHTFKRKLIRAGRCSADDVRAYVKRNFGMQFINVRNERQRLLLEHYLIARYKPVDNS